MKTGEGSIIAEDGRVIFFSADRFVEDICKGGCCFICGAKPGTKEFNDEHILPEWLLRQYGLFHKTIKLPNGARVRYDSYTVPCCAECNSLLGKEIETPISRVVAEGPDAIADFVVNGGLLLFVTWLGLIFFKTHLRDSTLRFHLDSRKGDDKIGDEYEWGTLHHIHALIRHFYTGCEVSEQAMGSFGFWHVHEHQTEMAFDYADLFASQALVMKLGGCGVVALFNDAGAAMNLFEQNKGYKINGAISHMQLREIHVELAWLDLHLKERSRFHTVRRKDGRCWIVAERGTLDLMPLDFDMRGEMMHHALMSDGAQIIFAGLDSVEATAEVLKSGRATFLFDDHGNFIPNPIAPV
jgi:hypothetical protein